MSTTEAPTPVVWDGPARIRRLAGTIALGETAGVLVPVMVIALMARISVEAMYVRSLYVPLALLFAALQVGFDVSNQVSASVSRGAGRPGDVLPVAASMARVGAAVWGTVSLALIVAAPWLATLLNVPDASVGDFVAFTRWACLANLIFFPTVLLSSSLRGYGRPGSAAAVVLTGATLEVGGVAVLGFGTDLGVYALPVAIAVGGVAALAVGLVQVYRCGLWTASGPLTWRPEAIGRLTGTGLPVTVSFVVMAVANAGLLWALSPFGPDVVSGYSAAGALQNLLIVPASALGSATAIVLNQSRGAGRPGDGPATLAAGLRLTAAVYAVLAAAIWLCREPLAAVLAGDPTVSAETGRFLAIVGLTYFGLGLNVMTLLLLEQVGGGLIALLLNVPYFGGMVVVGSALARTQQDPSALYWTIAVLNACGMFVVPLLTWRHVRRISRVDAR
ncbi:MATE family efflux transporter [Micromonospora sp. WMMD1128]|uniref:MATE family efflux transporter n=1 Tax=Micromonospora sp. WMMD1128 TaxID=3015150 RepID=UPI00248B7FE6|nr:MATE family efflux transporter [Micromonospora sp. WMMD1128]WBB73956.1 MATE family efflux transporter [Micromonospora sp. WMMD1128]